MHIQALVLLHHAKDFCQQAELLQIHMAVEVLLPLVAVVVLEGGKQGLLSLHNTSVESRVMIDQPSIPSCNLPPFPSFPYCGAKCCPCNCLQFVEHHQKGKYDTWEPEKQHQDQGNQDLAVTRVSVDVNPKWRDQYGENDRQNHVGIHCE